MDKSLRKCIVKIPTIINRTKYKGKKVGISVVREAEEHIAFFHKWIEEKYPIVPSILAGGDSGGQYSHTYALVEYENGEVCKVEPEYIRFVDNTMRVTKGND